MPTPKSQQKSQQQHHNSKQNINIIEDQRKEIETLKKQVESLTNSVITIQYDMTIINSKLEISSHVNDVLKSQVDELQQYSRRNCILLDNVPVKPKETTEDVEIIVQNILVDKFKCDKNNLTAEFDKAHRVGKKYDDNTQTIIVRLKSHSYRSNLYVNRKIHQTQKGNKYKLRVCLTSERRKLLSEVVKKVEGNEKVDFAYASVNGAIRIRTKEKFHNKNVFDIRSLSDIDELLVNFDCLDETAKEDNDEEI